MRHTTAAVLSILLFAGVFAQAQQQERTAKSTNPPLYTPMNPEDEAPQLMDIWGTCFFYRNCEGSAIGAGKTGAECRAQGGHSLYMPNHGCFNL